MADPKFVKKTVYNTSSGPRSIHVEDGTQTIIQPGGSAEVSVLKAELDDLHPDLSTSKPKARTATDAGEPVGSSPEDQVADLMARRVEELATTIKASHSDAELAAQAKTEKVSVAKDATSEQIALAMAQNRLGVKPA
jgi:hypothetical protein